MAFSQKGAQYANRERIEDPNLKLAFDDLASQIVALGNQVNVTPQGTTPPPIGISAISVAAADGIFDVALQDNNPVNRGIEYFLEYSLTADFAQPLVIHLGTSRNWRGHFGNQTLYWRAYSQYPTSAPSPILPYGGVTSPIAVVGGGNPGPTLHASTGSGTAPSNGRSGGQGYGKQQNRTLAFRNTA